MAKVKKSEAKPTLNNTLKLKTKLGQEISEEIFLKVLWADKMGVTVDGSEGSVTVTALHFEMDASNVEVWYWYGLMFLMLIHWI